MTKRVIGTLVSAILVFSIPVAPVAANAPAPVAEQKCGGKTKGAILGGVAGGILGNRLAGKGNRTIGTLVGAAGGALIGSAIGNKLDKCEKEKFQATTLAAVQDNEGSKGRPQKWQSDTRSDVHGTMVASAPSRLPDGRECRTVSRVSYIAGEEVRDEPRLCRKPPESAWAAA